MNSILAKRAFLAIVVSCMGTMATAATPPAPAASSPASTAAIVALIGDADCDNQTQCKVAGIGAKPCGGPSSYMAWSTKTADVAALRAAITAQSQAEALENEKRGLASDCMVRPDPTAVCRPRAVDGKKTCQLGQGGLHGTE